MPAVLACLMLRQESCELWASLSEIVSKEALSLLGWASGNHDQKPTAK